MMATEKLIEFKQKAKSKQPNFIRQEFRKHKRVPENWRKPRGIHSKLRLRRRGKPKMVSIGYKMPEQVRGLTRKGLQQVLVSQPEHLKYIKAGEVAVLKKMSNKKRLEIFQAAQKLNIQILNFRDVSKKIEEITAKLTEKKSSREKKEKKRTKKKEEEKKKSKMSQKAKEAEEKKKEKKQEKPEEKKPELPKEEPKKEEEKKKEIESKPEEKKEKETKTIKELEPQPTLTKGVKK